MSSVLYITMEKGIIRKAQVFARPRIILIKDFNLGYPHKFKIIYKSLYNV